MANILQEIREGMSVRDPSGAEIGSVEFVHFSDEDPSTPGPESVTVSPALHDQRTSWVDFIADAFRNDDLPESLRDRLLRRGFIRVDADGLFAADRYVMPDQIASVSGDQVVLKVGKDELLKR